MTDTETPEVTARVEENWAALEVDGETQTIRADTEEEVRHEVLRRTMLIAAETNTDVNLIATDRDGEWRLVVTPQGDISETANPTNAHGAHQGAEDAVDDDTQQGAQTDVAASDPAGTEPDDAQIASPSAVDEIPRWNDGTDARSGSDSASPDESESGAFDSLIAIGQRADENEANGDDGNETEVADDVIPYDEGTDGGTDESAPYVEGSSDSTEAVDFATYDGVSEETTVRPIGWRAEPEEGQALTNPTTTIRPSADGVISDPPPFVASSRPTDAPTTDRPDDAPKTDGPVDSPSIWDTVRRTSTPTDPPSAIDHGVDADPPIAAFEPPDVPESTPDPDALPLMAEPPAPTDGAPPSPADPPAPAASVLPTLADFQATQPPPVAGPATLGWRGVVRRGTGGLISPPPSASEQRHREAVASVTRSLSGPRTICVINPKGGAHKTTATMLIAATFGLYRGGYTLAWDNNETRGTLGWRAHQARHSNTAVDLLNDIDRFADLRSARVGDLDNYVRSQAEAQFDVLASDEDAAASSMIDDEAFRRLHETLQRFYRVIVVDTGNNMRASNWEAAIAAADQLVIVSAIREDTAGGAAWMVEGLARKGHDAKLREAVTILSAPDKNVDAQLRTRLTDYFGSLTRDVVEVPYDSALVSGAGISMRSLAPATRDAWLTATATIANGL